MMSPQASLESRAERDKHLRCQMGVRVSKDGWLVSDRPGPTFCIVTRSRDAYSETFIRAHIERLPGRVRVLYGKPLPLYTSDDEPLLASPTLHRLYRAAARRLPGIAEDHFVTRALRKYFCRSRVDLVLAEYGMSGVAVLDACRNAGLPLVVHFHGFDAYNHRILEGPGRRYPELFEYASALIAVSHDMERQLRGLGAPPAKVHYNPCGVDLELFEEGQPAEAPPRFLAVGRFVDKKAPHLTVQAFKRVVDEVPEARLTMIGDGYLLDMCKELASELGVAERVSFPGVRPHGEVASTMGGARAFVQHSVTTEYGDSEGTPVAILEAGASGLPVVATRHAGIPDVVVNGKTGLLVDEGDVTEMAKHMLQLAQEPELAANLGRAARQHIEDHFTMSKSIAKLWHILQGVL